MNIIDPHLTDEHRELLDIIWAFPTWTDLTQWAKTLSPHRQAMVDTLVYLLSIELVDELTEDMTAADYTDAHTLIAKVRPA